VEIVDLMLDKMDGRGRCRILCKGDRAENFIIKRKYI
jgi:hypothetical protein